VLSLAPELRLRQEGQSPVAERPLQRAAVMSLAPEQPPLQEALKLAQVVRRPVLVSLPVAE
jgi:hypothetical protein